MFNFMISNSKF